MINVSRVVNNPHFAKAFQLLRSSGTWVNGRFQDVKTTVNMFGIIQPSTQLEIELVPEGDRIKDMITVHSQQEMKITHTTAINDSNAGMSDIIIYKGQQYKIVWLYDWIDFGYYKAIGARLSGQ